MALCKRTNSPCIKKLDRKLSAVFFLSLRGGVGGGGGGGFFFFGGGGVFLLLQRHSPTPLLSCKFFLGNSTIVRFNLRGRECLNLATLCTSSHQHLCFLFDKTHAQLCVLLVLSCCSRLSNGRNI